MTTATEKYIVKAVEAAKKELGGNHLANVNVHMDMQADGATQILADALREQAKANAATSESMMRLALTLKPIDVCAIKMTSDGIGFGAEDK